jgi:hypothetical protein
VAGMQLDVAIPMAFGPSPLMSFRVSTDELVKELPRGLFRKSGTTGPRVTFNAAIYEGSNRAATRP